jgi:hypothetical protein
MSSVSDSVVTRFDNSANFTSIYFDTNILVGQGWPRISAALERVLSLCKSLNLAVFIPRVVEIEMENRWVRAYESTCDGLRSATHNYSGYHEILKVKQTASPELIESSTARAAYRDRVAHLKNHWTIGIVPVPSIPMVDVVQMASLRKIAFEETGVGFQDSLIVLSVLEHVRDTGTMRALVSNDGIFDRRWRDLATLAMESGCELVLFRNLDEISHALELRETRKTQELIKKDEQRAAQALQTEIDNLGRWLNDALDVLQLRGSQDWSSDIFQVTRVNSLRFVSIVTPFPLDRDEGQTVAITITVAGDAQMRMVDSPASRMANAILAGSSAGRYQGEPLTTAPTPYGGWRLANFRITRPVEIEIEANAVFRDGTYRGFVFNSAKLLKISGPSLFGPAQSSPTA